jgi:hypothetical protein
MATLTVQTPVRVPAPDRLTFAEADVAGDEFLNTGREALLLRNETLQPVNVTIATPQVVDGDLAVAERVVTIPAADVAGIPETCFLGPFQRSIYSNSIGKVTFTYSDPTGVTVAVVRIE